MRRSYEIIMWVSISIILTATVMGLLMNGLENAHRELFKEGTNFEKVQETIRDIYVDNKDVIDGMEYNQFDSEQTLVELNKKIKKWSQDDTEAKK